VSAHPRSVTIFTHARVAQTRTALGTVIDLARRHGVEVRLPPEEVEKHAIEPQDGVVLGADPADPTDLALVLGGDGTILSTLRLYAGREVPVFAVNFGAIGFLATVEPTELEEGIERALDGRFDVMKLPALVVHTEEGDRLAVNDLSFHRRPEGRVAELAYSVRGQELGEVRCDGLVVATPAGSTGYNLANGGPVLAWGVEGFVVSFIAPHTLTARALVVAPGDVLQVTNLSQAEEVELTTDGRRACALAPEARVAIHLRRDCVLLAQAPDVTFYGRMREKFGRLSY
jgi:NAD+ kinase